MTRPALNYLRVPISIIGGLIQWPALTFLTHDPALLKACYPPQFLKRLYPYPP
jgi:hypothetical protein